MNNVLKEMMGRYDMSTNYDKRNAIKEIVQEIVLCGLSGANFFDEAAFYGGTALRIFYGLDRFSEDLDFSLIKADKDFKISNYIPNLEKTVNSYGLNFKIEEKIKTKESDVKSAFLKGNTREHMLMFYSDDTYIKSITKSEIIKVKFEVDTTPPDYANFENKYLLYPVPHSVRLYDMPSLFAGKIHAVICRAWRNRIKGRDLYDYIFYIKKQTKVNLKHLNMRLKDSNYIKSNEELTLDELKEVLKKRFEGIDYEQAKQDVEPFIKNTSVLDIWGRDFFVQITDLLECENSWVTLQNLPIKLIIYIDAWSMLK